MTSQVVVIDDDDAVLDSFRFMLQAAGVQVVTYPSATLYLQQVTARPRCFILDQHMPRMTGLELAARLRADGIEAPIMLVTSFVSPAIIARAAELGIDRVLQKPASEDKILCFVDALE